MELLAIIAVLYFAPIDELKKIELPVHTSVDEFIDEEYLEEIGSEKTLSLKTREVEKGVHYIVNNKEGYVLADAPLIPTAKTPYRNNNISQEVSREKLAVKPLSNINNNNSLEVTNRGINIDSKLLKSCLETEYTVYFEYNKYHLDDAAYRAIHKAITDAKKCGLTKVYISGHATVDGLIENNMVLAMNRAKSISGFLTRFSELNTVVLNPLTSNETISKSRIAVIRLGK